MPRERTSRVLVYFAVILIVMLGFCGLAADAARLELRQLQLQAATDAGAIGGAAELSAGTGSWQIVATNDALANETNAGMSGVVNAAQLGASSGTYLNNQLAVQVTSQVSVPMLFMGLLKQGNVILKSTSIALATPAPCGWYSGTPGLTGSTPKGAGIAISSGSITLNDCDLFSKPGVEVDNSAYVSGTGQISTAAAASGSAVNGSMSQPLLSGVAAAADPLAYLSAPSLTGVTTYTQSRFGSNPDGANTASNPTLQPGVYLKGLTLSGTQATFSPGMYIIEGPAVFTNGTILGTGVTLYFTRNSAGVYGPVNWSAVSFKVSAPTSGPYAGVLIFGDRNWSGGQPGFRLPERFQLRSGRHHLHLEHRSGPEPVLYHGITLLFGNRRQHFVVARQPDDVQRLFHPRFRQPGARQ